MRLGFRELFYDRQDLFADNYWRPSPNRIFKPKEYKIVVDTVFVERYIEQPPYVRQVKFKKYKFYSFYHRYVCTMISQLNRYGIDGLLNPKPDSENGELLLRQQADNSNFNFKSTYRPAYNLIDTDYPREGFDFDFDSPYGIYNWELFFHAPLLIASKLSQNQKFEEAQKWFHYVFNPTETEGSAPKRYWKVKPFYEHDQELNIEDILTKMSSGDEKFNQALNQWMKNPFQPHAIARLRTVAYMKNVIMKYIENLIAWGDQLFRRDSIESINEATQLYVLAAQILGPKPEVVSRPTKLPPRTIEDIVDSDGSPGGFTNMLVNIESEIGDLDTGEDDFGSELNSLNSILYFCTKPNDKLLTYWDTIADRLFKIRNCQNIQGIERSLALFEPPIDPALLVKAAAAGLSIGDVLNNVAGATLPNYRFRVLIQKAIELCNDVKSLGQNLLSALEKKDAEELALLRSSQEVNLLKAVRQIRKQAIEEGKENVASLENAKELAEIRREYYNSREYMNQHEQEQLRKMEKALRFSQSSQAINYLASGLYLIPRVNVGISGAFGSPHATTEAASGDRFGGGSNAIAAALQTLSSIEQNGATKAGIKAGYDRRRDDWEFQTSLAEKELEQITKQITSAEIRLSMSERELVNHDMQIEQANEVQNFMKDKFTNRDLYNWMITQISGMYFQSYQLAYDVARMAEQAFQYELGQENTSYIQFGHWDSLKKGLLSGERLQADLRRLEIAYLEKNKREYELTKYISLALLSPAQLVRLREKGVCDFNVPEVLFDLDHPGQYMRRIKSVSVTIPGVTGPYTNINAKLTLLSNRIRKNTQRSDVYGYEGLEDDRFRHEVAGIQSIATSSAQNDSGMFQLNFQDDRYLPFEGTGAISSWRLELSSSYRQFDYDTISDVIVQMSYTAREGGQAMKAGAESVIDAGLNAFANEMVQSQESLQRVFSLKTHFPNALHHLLQPNVVQHDPQETTFDIRKEHFPYFLNDKDLGMIDNVGVLVKLRDSSELDDPPTTPFSSQGISCALEYGANQIAAQAFMDAALPYHIPFASFTSISGSPVDTWKIILSGTDLADKVNSSEVEDIYLIVNYTIS